MSRAAARPAARPAVRTRPRPTRCHLDELTAASESLTCRTTRWRARENARPRPHRHRIRLRGTPKSASCLDDSFFHASRVSSTSCRPRDHLGRVRREERHQKKSSYKVRTHFSISSCDMSRTHAKYAHACSAYCAEHACATT